MQAHGHDLVVHHDRISSSARFLILIIQLLWLLCCFWSYTVVVRTFGYEGFAIITPISATRLLVTILALIGLSLMLPRRLANPADYVVVGLFDVSFVPFCAYWALSGQPWWQELLVTVYWGIILFVSRLPIRLRARHVKGSQGTAFMVARGLVALGVILILTSEHLTLRLSLSDVYAVRSIWGIEGSGMSMYLFPWLANALLPLLLAHAWKSKRLGEILILGFTAYMLFTSTGMKAYLVMPALVAAVLLIARRHSSSSFIPVSLGILAGTTILLDKITRSVVWTSLALRRAVFVPARLTSVYLEFFSKNPRVHLSDSVLLRGWLRYPYPAPVPHIIGAYLGQPAMGANNGLAADGYANFGIVGVLIWAVLLGLLLKLLRSVTESPENRPEAWSLVTMWPVILLSSALTTSLLTHGLALGLLIAWALEHDGSSRLSLYTSEHIQAATTLSANIQTTQQHGGNPEYP